MSSVASTPWRLAQPPSQRKLGLSDAPVLLPYWEQYQPRTLGEVLGQTQAVAVLGGFLRSPSSRAILLHGPTGTGKTTSALALANDLGIDPFWGLNHVSSGRLDLEKCDEIMREMRLNALDGGWRAIIIDEADTMTPRARQILLSWLESIGPRTVIILTTNNPDAFTRRERSRFLEVEFLDSGDDALAGAQALADCIWREETGGEDGPTLETLPNAVIDGKVSFRSVCNALESLIRYGAPLQESKPHRPDTFTLPPTAAIAAPREAKPKPERKPAAPIATSPESWWNALTTSARVDALKRVPMSSIPFEKVRERVQELIRRGSPPEYARYLNMQPIIVAAWGASQ